ncbi:MAG TPA: tetratricopeptide repeat protein [Terriglobales bacterium]|nr:tetratricopeptide repeat protein [Terriglobales bacterium]
MRLWAIGLVLCLCVSVVAQRKQSTSKGTPADETVPQNPLPPRSDDDASSPDPHFPAGEVSSSKDTGVDISPPKDDAAKHPYSKVAVEGDNSAPASDVQEFHPWDPHRAIKNIEVGDFYLKQKNYRAAESRYREALVYKPDDAIAQLRLGQTLEKLGQLDEARQNYEGYLKILPDGPLAKEAHKGLARLDKAESQSK